MSEPATDLSAWKWPKLDSDIGHRSPILLTAALLAHPYVEKVIFYEDKMVQAFVLRVSGEHPDESGEGQQRWSIDKRVPYSLLRAVITSPDANVAAMLRLICETLEKMWPPAPAAPDTESEPT